MTIYRIWNVTTFQWYRSNNNRSIWEHKAATYTALHWAKKHFPSHKFKVYSYDLITENYVLIPE